MALSQQMYSAVNNSPKTALTVAITATSTLIAVDDAAKLPDGPNLAVIGYEADAEIIRYTTKDGDNLGGVTRGVNGTTAKAWPVGTVIARNFTAYDHEAFRRNIEELDEQKVDKDYLAENYYTKETIDETIDEIKTDTEDIAHRMNKTENDLEALAAQSSWKRYGVSGYGGESAAALTRLYDAVGMVAEVGTDGDNSEVRNDFDTAAPFMTKKCVGTWTLVDGKPKFNITAYEGQPGYAEDGSAGDYVAVEYPLSYWSESNGVRVIASHQYDGMQPFDIFRENHDPKKLLSKVYGPAYKMASLDGKPVSLPGLDPECGSYYALRNLARQYGDGSLANFAILQPAAFDFYEEFLMSIEFATADMQTIMRGYTEIRHNADDRVTFTDATHILTSNYQPGRVVGERICICPTNVDISDGARKATHTIISVIRCDASGNASASGTHQLIELQDLGRAYWSYDTTGATQYRIGGRAVLTGSCTGVSTSSGSVGANDDGLHPCKYRGRENPYGNVISTLHDLFNVRLGTSDDDRYLDWYYMDDPQAITPASGSEPTAGQLTQYCRKLSVNTPHANYVNGFYKTKLYDDMYKEIFIPGEMGGSNSTYFADYAFVVSSSAVRAVRSRGSWYPGRSAGPGYRFAYNAPSFGLAHYGGDLWFIQSGVN